jgi:hypothetical protein
VFPHEPGATYLSNLTDVGLITGSQGTTGLPNGASTTFDELMGVEDLNSVLKDGSGTNLIPSGTNLVGMYGDLKVALHLRPNGSGSFTTINDITPTTGPIDFQSGDLLYFTEAGRNPLLNAGDADSGGYLIVSDNKTGFAGNFTGSGTHENPQGLTLHSGGFSVSAGGVGTNNDNYMNTGPGTATDANHIIVAAKFQSFQDMAQDPNAPFVPPSGFPVSAAVLLANAPPNTLFVGVGTTPVSSTNNSATRTVGFGFIHVVGGTSASSFRQDTLFTNSNTVGAVPLGGPTEIVATIQSQRNLGVTGYTQFQTSSNDPINYVGAPVAPGLTTTPSGLVVVGSGVALNDTATLSGGFNPTGTLTFQLFAPDGTTVVYTDVVTVTGNGSYRTATQGNNPGGFVPTVPGTYNWVVSYSGDSANNPVSTKFGDEPEIAQARPGITTMAGGTVVIGSGLPLTDSATLSGGLNPTGTIEFDLFLVGTTDTLVYKDTVTVNGNGTYDTSMGNNPGGFVPTAAGTYQWFAVYSGDKFNAGVSSNFGDEPETVSPASPTLVTTPSPKSVTLGTTTVTLKDSAVLSGGFNPTGSITFTLFYNGGSTPVDTETVTVSGNGTYTTPTGFTLPTNTKVTGTYQWAASYTGDANNKPFNDSNSGTEFVMVSPASPGITTTPGGDVALGSGVPLTDSATLSGGYFPTGSITFTLTNPGGTVVDTETVTVNGDGTYTTPNGFVPTVVGTYHWVAAYSGDGNNNSISSNAGDEPETVTPPSPSITTSVADSTIIINSGAFMNDSATLSGGFNPTGTITFTLTDPTDTVVYTDHVTVNGNGTYGTFEGDNPFGFLPTRVGVYQWVAAYSGDNNNGAVSSKFGDEPQTVIPSLLTFAIPGGTNPLDPTARTLTDQAMLKGGFNPTGTITFTLFFNSGTTPVDTETVNVNGNGTYTTPTGFTLPATGTVAGTYQWDASYSGDANNPSVSDINDPEEQTVLTPASPTLVTTPSPANPTLGTTTVTLTDSAALSGGYFPTGSITFTLFYNGGSTPVDTETVTVNGNGTYTKPTGFTLPTNMTVTGTYQWVASYSGDGNNLTATDSNDPDEQVTVPPASPTINTTPGGTVVLGSGAKLTDSATLSSGYFPTGSITFTLTDPSGTTVDTETVTVNGDGTYTTPNGFLPTAVGTYHWAAAYSGDGNNNPISSAQEEEDEPEQVITPPTITTKAGGLVVLGKNEPMTDSATLGGGLNPTGTITFTLTAPDGVTVVHTEAVTVNGDATYTTPNGFVPTTAGTYQWVAAYSGDEINPPVSSQPGSEPQKAVPFVPPNFIGKVLFLGSQTPGQLAADGAFVNGLYEKLLDRAPDQGEVNAWVFLLEAGVSRAVVADDIFSSPEHQALQMTGFYQTFLGRTASAAEEAAWLRVFQAGANEAAVEQAFRASPEFRALHANFQGPTAFLAQVVGQDYTRFLGRTAVNSEVMSWVGAIESGLLTQDAVAVLMLASPEFYAHPN